MSRLKPLESEGENTPMSFRLPVKLKARLERIANDTDKSLSEVMEYLTRWACDEYEEAERLEREGPGQPEENFCAKCGQPLMRRASDRSPEAEKSAPRKDAELPRRRATDKKQH